MDIAKTCRVIFSFQFAIFCAIAHVAGGRTIRADEPIVAPAVEVAAEGPIAALEFEKSFRDPVNRRKSKPIRLDQCENITELTKDFWSKKHVLSDFKKHRSANQIGAIVIVKTEYCCKGSRLCAVTTACLEKKSTPLIARFRVYAGWIKNNPDHPDEEWEEWEDDVIEEYDFIQGPGARIVVMVPLGDGQMYEWHNTATKLGLGKRSFEKHMGETPKLESFLQVAIQYAPPTVSVGTEEDPTDVLVP